MFQSQARDSWEFVPTGKDTPHSLPPPVTGLDWPPPLHHVIFKKRLFKSYRPHTPYEGQYSDNKNDRKLGEICRKLVGSHSLCCYIAIPIKL